MTALIPALTAALGYLRQGQSAASPPKESFSQLLDAASQTLSASESAAAAPSAPRYVVQAGDNLSLIAKKFGYENPQVLARANNLKNPDQLQIGQTLTLPENPAAPFSPGVTRLAKTLTPKTAAVAPTQTTDDKVKARLVAASWYGSQHHGKLMANGQPFDMYADTAAHKSLPFGTTLTLTNPQTGASVKVKVTDRGPFVAGRNLDLSYGAARKLGMLQSGVAKLRLLRKGS
ncbi:MAG: septal ring lytic transglycosylase RlpA family protein [Desulfobaccales bacterium]